VINLKVSVLIPTKDEPFINKLVQQIHKQLAKYNHEIIVIDKSEIIPKIKDAKVLIQKSDGLGKAVLEGLQYATGNVIVTMDGDGSHRPEDIPKLLEKIGKYDIVIGSRFTSGGKSLDYSTLRSLVSKSFSWIVWIFLGIKIKDSMSGFSAIKKKVYNKLQLNPLGYKINMEILYRSKNKFRSIEVPILFLKRKAGKPKPKAREGIRTLIFISKLRLGF